MTDAGRSTDEAAPAPRSGLRRLILALLVPDAVAWGWLGITVTAVLLRDDVAFSPPSAAAVLLTAAGAATIAVVWGVVRAVGERRDDPLRPVTVVTAFASVVLWVCAFGLAIVTVVAAR